MPEIIIIAALSQNDVIGKAGSIPWKLKEDFRHFKKLTLGHPCVMGRKTFESLPEKARPLPGRENIILTSNKDYHPAGVGSVEKCTFKGLFKNGQMRGVPQIHDRGVLGSTSQGGNLRATKQMAVFQQSRVLVFHSWEEAYKYLKDRSQIYICGGGSIYQLLLPLAHKLELTRIQKYIEGDVYFPKIIWDEWELTKEELREGPDQLSGTSLKFSFLTYQRKDQKL